MKRFICLLLSLSVFTSSVHAAGPILWGPGYSTSLQDSIRFNNGSSIDDDALQLEEQATAPTTPAAGKSKIFPSTNGPWYSLDSTGETHPLADGVFNYVSNAGAEYSATTGTSVTGSFSRTRGTTASTFSDSYFQVATGTTETSSMDWSLDALQEKHDGSLMHFSYQVRSPGPTASNTYKVGLYNSTDATYVTGTELTIETGSSPEQKRKWEALFVLDTSKTYVVRFERIAGDTDETFYIDDVKVTPEQTIAGSAVSGWRSGGSGLFSASGGTQSFYYRQNGDTMDLIAHIAGATWSGSGTLLLTLPNNLTVNTSVVTAARVAFGSVIALDSSATDYFTGTAMYSGTSTSGQIQIGGDLADSVWSGSASRPFAWQDSSDVLSIRASVPIAEWAGVVQTFANSQVEYAYNSSGITAAGASDTTSFAYGPAGAQFGSIDSTTTTGNSRTTMRVRFQNAIQDGDVILLKYRQSDVSTWTVVGQGADVSDWEAQNTARYGMGWSRVSGSNTDIDVFFGNAGRFATGATFGVAGSTWSGLSTARWAAVKSSNPLGIGTGLATATQPGAISAEYQSTEQDLGTLTWTGTTAPSGTISKKYRWARTGKRVDLWILITATVVGSALTSVNFDLPSDMPTPSAFSNAGAARIVGSGDLGTSAGDGPSNGCSFLYNSGSGNQVWIKTSSATNAGMAIGQLTYFVD